MDKKEIHPQEGAGLIASERERSHELWGDEHDDNLNPNVLLNAGIAYALASKRKHFRPECWPFEPQQFEFEIPMGCLIKAGAFIAAEIDRERRKFQAECNAITLQNFGFRCFDELDAYDLEEADWAYVAPKAFIEEHFAEDYARIEGNDEDQRLSDEAEHIARQEDTDNMLDEIAGEGEPDGEE